MIIIDTAALLTCKVSIEQAASEILLSHKLVHGIRTKLVANENKTH